ncbi:acyl-CoA thioesterase [Nocardioides marmoriginsengisoli]|uniref:Acyl-CoA thioesterase n=1 Tax=Nocardioides marmoriginsengisoli TaxID=661483 RepID=A0A3N0CIB9_9ACTN|nr:thioesterase family protein [Nocardioides marmoriginsengisoli]RNL63180.1 acyl-CoA thioesterase [Nocardioides marmoriginsengisoli]
MRHTYECPLRWADMDLLGHINNVAYVDYLQEARIAMLAEVRKIVGSRPEEGVVVVRHELDFAAPLKYRKRPVLIDTWVSEVRAGSFTTAYEIYDETPEGRVVYLRAWSRLAPMSLATGAPRRLGAEERDALAAYVEPAEPRTALTAEGRSQHVYPVHVRWSDLDTYHHVNNVKFIEYFQESRIAYTRSFHQEGDVFGAFVVARIDVDFLRPITYRAEPYEAHNWISKVGRTSAVFASEIRDGDAVLARSQVVAVGFDPDTQRSAPLPPDHHGRLLEQLALSGLG